MAYGVGWLKKQQSPLEYTGCPLTPEEPVLPTTIWTVAVAVVKSRGIGRGKEHTQRVGYQPPVTYQTPERTGTSRAERRPRTMQWRRVACCSEAVPTVMAAGVGQVMIGVAWVTVMVVLPVAPV